MSKKQEMIWIRQALLIALLRYKGYEARFVTGNVDIEINKVMNWLGVKTEKAAVMQGQAGSLN